MKTKEATNCDYCTDAADQLVEATVVDASGGSLVRLCDDCRRRADRQRCGLCGDRVDPTAKADGVIFHDSIERRGGTAICDECRSRAIFDAREAR